MLTEVTRLILKNVMFILLAPYNVVFDPNTVGLPVYLDGAIDIRGNTIHVRKSSKTRLHRAALIC